MQSSGIHCKVATQNEVRRFLLSSPDYQSLLVQVCQLFGFSKDSVVIKYADDEGDFVTISSDEEVKFAIEVAKGVLRLRVDQKHQPAITQIANAPVLPGVVFNKDQNEDADDEDEESANEEEDESSGEHPKWNHKKNCRMMSDPARLQSTIQRMQHKRGRLQEKLAFLDSAAESGKLGKHKHNHRDKIRNKVSFLTSRIDHLSEVARQLPASGNPTELLPVVSPGVPVNSPAVLALPSASLPAKEEVLAQLSTFQATTAGLRIALRQATLQMQLQRTKLQAATHRINDGDAPGSPPVSEAQIQELRDALATAKANHAAAKAELRSQVQKMDLYVHQLKAIKQQEKAEHKAKKAVKQQEKVAKKAEKALKKNCSFQETAQPVLHPESM